MNRGKGPGNIQLLAKLYFSPSDNTRTLSPDMPFRAFREYIWKLQTPSPLNSLIVFKGRRSSVT